MKPIDLRRKMEPRRNRREKRFVGQPRDIADLLPTFLWLPLACRSMMRLLTASLPRR